MYRCVLQVLFSCENVTLTLFILTWPQIIVRRAGFMCSYKGIQLQNYSVDAEKIMPNLLHVVYK